MTSKLDLSLGTRYELLSSEDSASSVSVMHVKLTDASLKAFEEFNKSQAQGEMRPATIRFEGKKGAITVPLKETAALKNGAGDNSRTFWFTVSAVCNQEKEKFECIRQTNSGGGGRAGGRVGRGSSSPARAAGGAVLQTMGAMSQIIRVQATNEDTFEATRAKVSLAEEQSKKQRTQEIKPSGVSGGRLRNTRRAPKVGALQAKVLSIAANHMQPGSQAGQKRTRTGPPASNPLSGMGRGAGEIKSEYPRAQGPPGGMVLDPAGGKYKRMQFERALDGALSSSLGAGVKRDVSGLEFRARVVHQLALKSYTRAELLLKLREDGIQEDEKAQLGPLLQEVAVEGHKDGRLTLHRPLYGEVTLDWPLYTDTDRIALAGKLTQVQGTASSDSPAISPCHSQGRMSPAPPMLGGQTEGNGGGEDHNRTFPPAQRQRVAHIKKSAATSQPAVTPANGPVQRKRGRPSSDRSHKTELGDARPKDDPDENHSDLPPETADFVREYVRISSDEQLRRYRREFDSLYCDYSLIHARMSEHKLTFDQLSRQIHEHSPGSMTYERLKAEVFSEYARLKSNTGYTHDRERFQLLHSKLAHIKRLVKEYDQRKKN